MAETQNLFPNILLKSSKARGKPSAPFYWQICTKPPSYPAIIKVEPYAVELYSTTESTL